MLEVLTDAEYNQNVYRAKTSERRYHAFTGRGSLEWALRLLSIDVCLNDEFWTGFSFADWARVEA